MRITNNTAWRNALSGITTNSAAMAKLQSQISSGKRVESASDDPVAAGSAMGASSTLRALDQYGRNIGTARSRLAAEDTALDTVTNLLTRAKELAISQASTTSTASTRLVAAAEMEQLFRGLVAQGGTKLGEDFLFGGEQSRTAPFAVTGQGATLDYTTTVPTGTLAVEIAPGQSSLTSHDGKQVFLDSGALAAVRDATRALANNDPAALTASLQSLDAAIGNVQITLGEAGARANRLESTEANLAALRTNLRTYNSNLTDVDLEKVVTELANRQAAYQAAMLATSRILSVSLTEFIR